MTFWDRITGRVVDAAQLGQKKRAVTAGITGFDGPLGDLRLEMAIKGHPWLRESATTSLLLATWIARACQDMAAVLETTAQRTLGEANKIPEATFVLADQLYSIALVWIENGQAALAAVDSDPDFSPPGDLPTAGPRLDWVADAPPAHYAAVIQAAAQLGTNVEDALNGVQADRSRLPQKYDRAFSAVESAMRVARAKLDQVEAAASDRQAVRLNRDIWSMLQEVVSTYFRSGQQIARPALLDSRYDPAAAAAARARRLPPPPAPQPAQPGTAQPSGWPSLPPRAAPQPSPALQAGPPRPSGQAGRGYAPRTMSTPPAPPPPPPPPPTLGERLGLKFDAWALTDPSARSMYRNDPRRIAELEAFWRADTNPDETYRLFGLVMAAVQANQVAVRTREFTRACPWIPTFVALADTTIGSDPFTAGQLFTFRVGQDGSYFSRGFERMGFLPGTQPPKVPRAGAGPGVIDTVHHGDRTAGGGAASRTARAAGPDIWLLTAAFQRPQRRHDPADTDKLRKLWSADPDPAATVRLHDELMAAVRAGTVRQHGDESLRDCPWSQVYVAVSAVTIAGVALQQNEKFALTLSLTDGAFKRSISRLGSVRTGG